MEEKCRRLLRDTLLRRRPDFPGCPSLPVLCKYWGSMPLKKKKKKKDAWPAYGKCNVGTLLPSWLLKGSKTEALQGVNCFVCSLRKTSLIFYCPAFAQSSKLSLGKWLILKRDAVMAEDVLASLPISDSL